MHGSIFVQHAVARLACSAMLCCCVDRRIDIQYPSNTGGHRVKVPKILTYLCATRAYLVGVSRLVAGGRQHNPRVYQALLCVLSWDIREEEKEWRKPLLPRCSFAISSCLCSSSLSCLCALATRSEDLFKELMGMERGRTYPQHPH